MIFTTLLFAALSLFVPEPTTTWLIRGAQVVDGTGGPITGAERPREGDRILEVGSPDRQPDELVVNGNGLALAPGFIDVHNHSTEGPRAPIRSAQTQVSQGITTLVLGPDGGSPWPIGEYLTRARRRRRRST